MGDTPSSWPPNAMTYYSAGYTAGLERGRDQVETEMAALHAVAYLTIQSQARTDPYDVRQTAIKARWVAACQRNQAAVKPWPPEDA